MNKKIPIIAIVGPTATGKTSLSVNLAEIIGGEIISCDSMQIYKDMHIASAAPDFEEKRGIPHHLFEVKSRNEIYSVAEYVKDAKDIVSQVYSRDNMPIFVGGTGLYISSLVDNITFLEEKTSQDLRLRLEKEYEVLGGQEMLKRLAVFDKISAETIHPNNKKRVIRAFEIYQTTGITMSEQLKMSKTLPSPFEPYIIGLKAEDRSFIYNRINKRVDIMLENGLLEEAERAYISGGSATAVQAIGHKEFFRYFNGEISLDEAVETLKRETRRYAKRQLTWFSRDERIEWIDIDKTDKIIDTALKILERKGFFEQKKIN